MPGDIDPGLNQQDPETGFCSLVLDGMAGTGRAAACLAAIVRPGDVLALHGTLGVGKTAFSRAFIRAAGQACIPPRQIEEVPSPTFTLVQQYELDRMQIWHFDLYRLCDPEEAWEIGIEEAFADGLSLIEWPDRLGGLLPRTRLDIRLSFMEAPEEGGAGADADEDPGEQRRLVLASEDPDMVRRVRAALATQFPDAM